MASAEYPNKAVRLAHEPTACKAPIESPSVAPDDTPRCTGPFSDAKDCPVHRPAPVAPDDTPTRLDEIEKRWQDQADINTDVQFLLAEVTRLREALQEAQNRIAVQDARLAHLAELAEAWTHE
jgi:hypothetical protein